MVTWKYINSFTTVIYTFRVLKHIIGQSTNINVFSWLLSFCKLRERERESGIQNLGIKEKCPQSYLSYFTTGFHWRIFLLSRATRLCSVFNTGLKNLGSFVSQFFFCLQPGVKWLWFVCHELCSKTNFLLFTSAEGKGSPLPFWGPSQSFGFSLLPLGVRRPGWGHQVPTSVYPLCDPHSLLTVTFLTARYC